MSGSVLFFGKKSDLYCGKAVELIEQHFDNCQVILGTRHDKWPENIIANWEGDFIISYLSPWIIPEALLVKAKQASINFHPGPPEYPGIGCTNFAIYHQETTYGVTCHHMNSRVDTGAIITVKRFSVSKDDTVYDVTQRCYAYIWSMFNEIISLILNNEPLPRLEETWQRKPYKRQEFNELCRITLDMPEEEIQRRVKAVTFPNTPGAFIEVDGEKMNYLEWKRAQLKLEKA
jgi:methionyl-tRNA formyltransferase